MHLYTGEGKGKTTAALGLAMRAAGQGWRVAVLQFMKGQDRCGEHIFVERFPGFAIFQPRRPTSFCRSPHEQQADAAATLTQAGELASRGGYDMLVLDEAVTAVHKGYLNLEDLLVLVREKPICLELVLTGRGAPPELVAAADLVTEMVKVKHPLDRGIKARKGVEY